MTCSQPVLSRRTTGRRILTPFVPHQILSLKSVSVNFAMDASTVLASLSGAMRKSCTVTGAKASVRNALRTGLSGSCRGGFSQGGLVRQ